jgi:hypothetical protein
VKYCQAALAIAAALSVSLALADDFKTNNAKEYKNAIVTQVDADGIVVKTKTGISKLYFTELPEDVRKRYNYDPGKAAAYAAQASAAWKATAQQADESNKQWKEQQQQQAGKAANQQNIQALENAYQDLLQQEQDLLVAIGRIKNARENARRKWVTRPWGQNEPQAYQYQTDPAEANLPLFEGRLENVRDEKKRVREELARAQRVSR